jgi:hypothetical protein
MCLSRCSSLVKDCPQYVQKGIVNVVVEEVKDGEGRIVSTLRLLKMSSDVEDKVTNVVMMRRCEGYEIK